MPSHAGRELGPQSLVLTELHVRASVALCPAPPVFPKARAVKWPLQTLDLKTFKYADSRIP